MKVAVDRLWQHYFAESAGKIRSKAEGGAGRRKYSQKRAENTNQGGSRASGIYTGAGRRNARAALSTRRGRQMRGRAATGARSLGR